LNARPTIYIAGPMRGYAEYNFPAFDAAAKAWRKAGWIVINPAELDRVAGIHEYTDPLPEGFLRAALKRDLEAICSADAIGLLPGWEPSGGVKVEKTLAEFLKLPVLDATAPVNAEAWQWK
jgi:hypothetical protein